MGITADHLPFHVAQEQTVGLRAAQDCVHKAKT